MGVDQGATGRRRVRTVRDAFPFVPVTFENTQKLNWLGTLRARLGWTPIDRWLIYATGGFAFGESTASFSVVSPAAVPPIAATSTSKAKTGWVLGGGVEYAVTNNWIVRGEYLHYDLGRKSSRITYNYPPDTSTLTGHTRHSGDIARVGVNYKF